MSDTVPGPIDEGRRRRFETSWHADRPLPIESCLPPADSPRYLGTLEELVHIELEFAAKRGDRGELPTVESYVARFPGLDDPTIVARLHEQRAAVAKPRPQVFAPGKRFGRYRLVDEFARGGFGSVWRAVDDELGREIALKQLSGAVARDPESRRRFVHEAKVTARLEHPGVVPVYDVARLQQEPFFYAMKLVRGGTLADAIERLHALPQGGDRVVEQRRLLGAFLVLCQTMEYAHAAGVVHRDLKPQNVVLSDYGETVILDWGLAKRELDGDGSAASAAPAVAVDDPTDAGTGELQSTLPGTVKGTPAFMSPEQAAGRVDEVDALSDIYSLGVILYQLLTGELPFDGETSDAIMLRVIAGAPRRPRTIDASIQPALEAICLRAMAKERADRYPDVAALTRDLQHYLADEPVAAFCEPLRLRIGRWTRRHRVLVTGLASAVVVVLGALAVIATVLTVSNRRLREANEREAAAKTRAEANFAMAQDAVQKYFTLVSESPRLKTAGLEPLRRELLTAAGGFYSRIAAQRSDDPAVRYEQARALIRTARITAQTARMADALEPCRQAEQILRELLATDPGNVELRKRLADTHSMLGAFLHRTGRDPLAEPQFREALRIAGVEVTAPRDVLQLLRARATAHHNLASLLEDAGQRDDAETHQLEALALHERAAAAVPGERAPRIELVLAALNAGWMHGERGRLDEAERLCTRALETCGSLRLENPDADDLLALMGAAQRNLALLAARRKRWEQAEASHIAARDLFRTLTVKHPCVPSHVVEYANSRSNLMLLYLGRERDDDALVEAVGLARLRLALTVMQPSVRKHSFDLAAAHLVLADIHERGERYTASLTACDRAVEIATALVEREAGNADYAFVLGKAHRRAGEALYGLGEKAAAVARFDRAIPIFQKLYDASPDTYEYRSELSFSLQYRPAILERLRRYAEAAEDWKRMADLRGAGGARFAHRHALARGRIGDHGAAAAYGDKLLDEGDADRAYDIAVLFALAASVLDGDESLDAETRKARVSSYADVAVDQLRRAHAGGWFGDAARRDDLEREGAFAILERREDGRAVLRAIRGK